MIVGKWIQIFEAGTHTDSAGVKRTYTADDISRTAQLYQERKVDAPLTLGHPKGNGPAYGWIADLKAEAGKLLMLSKDVTENLKDWTKKRMFKYVSPSFYPDGRIRHLAFLGDTPPAVKNLPEVPVAAFAEGEEFISFDEAPIEFEEDAGARYGIQDIARIFGRLREWIISKHGIEDADQVVKGWEIESLKDVTVTLEPVTPSPIPAYAEGKSNTKETDMTLEEAQKMINDLNAQIQQLNGQVSEFSESKVKLEQLEAEKAVLLKEKEDRAKKDIADFMESQKALPEKLKNPLSSLLYRLTVDGEMIEFAEGNETKKENAAGLVKELIKAKAVPMGEFARKTEADATQTTAADFAEHGEVDEDRLGIHNRALAVQKEKNISYSEAVNLVMAEGGK